MGPSWKLTPAVHSVLVKAANLGMTRQRSAQVARISYSTLRSWLRAGEEDPEGPYGAFAADFNEAEGKCLMGALETVHKASSDNWNAAAWLAERRFGYTRDGAASVEPAEEEEAASDDLLDGRSIEEILGLD